MQIILFSKFYDWEQRQIKKIGSITAGGDVDKSKLKISGRFPVLANALQKDGVIGYYDDYRSLSPAVTITGRGNIGHAKARHNNFTAVVRLLVLKPNEGFRVDFLEHAVNNLKIFIESTGVPQLTGPQFGNYTLTYPTFEEQTAVGNLMKNLDIMIALHQRKVNILLAIKKAYLNAVFPLQGENKPNLRFNRFNEEWEQRKLNDVLLQMKSGLSRKLSATDIGLPVIRANNINNGELDLSNDIKYWYVHDPQGAKISNYLVKENDILVNFINSESKMGTSTIVLKEPMRDTIYTTNVMKLKVNLKEYHPYFIFQQTFTNQYKNYIKIITKPAVNQSSFTTEDFKKYNFHVPNYNEQKKISDLLQTLEDLITLHQKKINNFNKLKKVYLHKMFL